jgi:hypothetical protein
MSLNREEIRRTSAELHANLELSGLTVAQLADQLGLSEDEAQQTLDVTRRSSPATVWLVRDHLEAAVTARGGVPHPYTVLTENMRSAADRWFGLR